MAEQSSVADEVAQKLSLSSDPAPAPVPAEKPAIIGPMPAPSKTADEMYEELKSTPFFMTEISEDNDAVAALQALAYEGTPLENATDFKTQGNDCFRAKRWKDAKEFYAKGIEVLALEERKRNNGETTKDPDTGVPDEPHVIADQRAMLESLYANRAACNLELRNFRACWTDCTGALRLNPRNVKCWYRSAKALLAVDRLDDAADAAARGLAVDPANAALQSTQAAVVARRAAIAEKERREQERRDTQTRRRELVRTALAARGIRTRVTEKPPPMEGAAVRLLPDEDDPTSSLVFPTLLLYPTDYESDFIKEWSELDALDAHLGYIFPLPWDKDGNYTLANVECYMETTTGGLMKVGKKLSLLRILSDGKTEVVDQVVKIFVVPKNKAEAWVKEYKEAKAKEAGKQ
ncbi:hypothetical protein TD95_003048 [Thielaviopsis punctulata]|uniref:Cns1/TTC4 wheel domain-containing protein n=1 Tax=Thielaviopsis punctulata TaxID=72032 RepID=A0A0F4ZEU7_9PEZI|nr:hypothetical protein TD95_003048 [Thielaviopsis punctulata]